MIGYAVKVWAGLDLRSDSDLKLRSIESCFHILSSVTIL